MSARVRLRLYGAVQGVGFRYFALRAAHRLDLAGWVRNRADGSVELEAAGPPDALADFLRTVRSGPPHADVRKVEELPAGSDPLPRPFAVTR